MPTPEGVTLDVTLAGLGSRMAAAIIDQLLRFAVMVVLVVLGAFIGPVAIIGIFVVQFGYDIVFETWSAGQTPGKRWSGLRVVKDDGGPISFRTSAIRNVLRLVDLLPALYLVGIISVLATKRNQRLGDLAAGTIVVSEQAAPSLSITAMTSASTTSTISTTGSATTEGDPSHDVDLQWDVSAVTVEELSTVRRFLERRPTLTPQARARLGADLAARLQPKVAGQPTNLSAERFLEGVVAIKAKRS